MKSISGCLYSPSTESTATTQELLCMRTNDWHNLHLKDLMLYNKLFLELDIMAIKPNRLVHYDRSSVASKCDHATSQPVTILRNSSFLCIIHVGEKTDLKTLNQISTY